MAGAGLIAIKGRIKSVTNTKKITKAMGLVATAKLRKSRERLVINEDYYTSINEVMGDLLENYEGHNIFTHGNKCKNRLFIVVTSESGLCGSFNGSVVSKAIEDINKNRSLSQILVIGQKGKAYFNKLKYETVAEYVEVPDIPTTKEAAEISRITLELFEKGEVGEVYIVFAKFFSAVKFVTTVEKLLPLDLKCDYQYKDYVAFEPNIGDMIEGIIRQYIKSKVFNCMLNSKASEHSSRMNAMDGATKNANDLLEKLNLQYNRIRQSSITQEISEIVGGAEAQR